VRRATKSESPKSKNQTKTCFVICPIGKEGSEQREWSDTVINEIIRPVAETHFQYHVFRADEIPAPGTITRQIVEHLISSELVIADLSFNNPNVFYELAVRHVTRKPYIQMINQKESIPFDAGAIRTIQFNTDIKYANKAKRELEIQISAIECGEFKIDNPIGDAIDLMSLKNSDSPENYQIATLVKSMSEIQSQLFSLTQNIENRSNRDFWSLRKDASNDPYEYARQKAMEATQIQSELDELNHAFIVAKQCKTPKTELDRLQHCILEKEREFKRHMRGYDTIA